MNNSKNEIKYVGFYDDFSKPNENRNCSIAAINLMDYIADAITKSDNFVTIVSLSYSSNNTGFYKKRDKQLRDSIHLIMPSTFGAKNKLTKIIRLLKSWLWLFKYLLLHTKKNGHIIVYHSMWLIIPVILAKKIRKFELVLQVSEIYQDVLEYPNFLKKLEYKIIEIADKYIFSTELLNEKLNHNNKPRAIIYGTYHVEKNEKSKFEDDKIHVVYAGTFDPRKGGATAAAAAEYLPKNYHVHIIGFGSNEDIKSLLDKIEKVVKKSDATITYDGLLKGKEYIEFLQKCDIGLSTQIPDGTYNETSFPSKILSYMANGLRVVTVRIKAIEMSAVSKYVYYYGEQSPEAIAKAIMEIDINRPYDSKDLIKKLDDDFVIEIKNLIEK